MKKTMDKAQLTTLKELKSAQEILNTLNNKLSKVIAIYELPIIEKGIGKFKKLNPNKKITVAWLQKKFRIGFAQASKLKDDLNL